MTILEDIKSGRILVCDGATGTYLMECGLAAGECPEFWNLDHPDEVTQMARAYYEAGADIVLTNTYGTLRTKLSAYGFENRVAELASAGVKLARSVCPEGRYVVGSVGITGDFLEPFGSMCSTEMIDIFKEQMSALAEAGVDALCIETVSALDEAICAVRAAREASEIPIFCTMNFVRSAQGFHTSTGVTPTEAALGLAEAGADVIGSNCGNGIKEMIDIAAEMRAASNLPILINANAGLPQVMNGRVCYVESPEFMALHVEALIKAGANIIGGCCGTNPAHICAIRKRVDAWNAIPSLPSN